MEDKDEATWQYTLQMVAAGVFTVLFRSGRYCELLQATKDFLYEIASVLVNILCFIFFPISIPLLFLTVRKIQRDNFVRRQVLLGKLKPEDFE